MESESNAFKDKYVKVQQIASGTYGIVYKGKNIITKQMVAIKKFKNVANQGLPTSAIREINAFKNIKSDFLLPILDIYAKKDSVKVVMPWKNLTLAALINSAQSYNTKLILYQILKGVGSIHEHNYAHRDIKPSNIVLDEG